MTRHVMTHSTHRKSGKAVFDGGEQPQPFRAQPHASADKNKEKDKPVATMKYVRGMDINLCKRENNGIVSDTS
jgi:hypothetical protein